MKWFYLIFAVSGTSMGGGVDTSEACMQALAADLAKETGTPMSFCFQALPDPVTLEAVQKDRAAN